MKKVEDYKAHAEECRVMARNTTNEEHRHGLVKMAETWDGLANDRAEQLQRLERLKDFDKLSSVEQMEGAIAPAVR